MRPSPFQAFVRVMMGCDKFCTYCIVPSVRGPEQSRPPAAILAEARLLADQGVKEITLLGQTVNSYHFREPDGRPWRLSDLLERIHDIDGIERIKFITNFPNDMTDDLLQAVRDLPKVSRYLHVPAQSGCDEILKRMKRMYTVASYEEMLARVRETIPGVAVSSDFIVGFCGETDASFERTVGLVERSRFKNSFIFKYSAREGTKADQLYPDDVPEAVKKRRNDDLLALADGHQPGGQPPMDRPDGRGAGRGAEPLDDPSRWLGRDRPAHGADGLRPDRGLRRERAADRPDGPDRRGRCQRRDALRSRGNDRARRDFGLKDEEPMADPLGELVRLLDGLGRDRRPARPPTRPRWTSGSPRSSDACRPGADPQAIAAWEDRHGYRLPAGLRAWLMLSNGLYRSGPLIHPHLGDRPHDPVCPMPGMIVQPESWFELGNPNLQTVCIDLGYRLPGGG